MLPVKAYVVGYRQKEEQKEKERENDSKSPKKLCTIWDSGARWRVRRWPMRTSRMIGGSLRISRRY
jgi:hypothetical protein